MPKTNRSFYVDPYTDDIKSGFNCFCFVNGVQVEKRFFVNEIDAYTYGTDWLKVT